MALIARQQAAVTGPEITYAAATASDTIQPHSRGVLLCRTSGTGSTVTVVVPGNDEHGQPKPDVAVALAATADHAIATSGYVDNVDSSGLVTITSSDQTTLEYAFVLV